MRVVKVSCHYLFFVYVCTDAVADTTDIVRCSLFPSLSALTTWFLFDFHFILYCMRSHKCYLSDAIITSCGCLYCIYYCASSSHIRHGIFELARQPMWENRIKSRQKKNTKRTKERTRNVWTRSISIDVSYKYSMCSQLCTWAKLIQLDVVNKKKTILQMPNSKTYTHTQIHVYLTIRNSIKHQRNVQSFKFTPQNQFVHKLAYSSTLK